MDEKIEHYYRVLSLEPTASPEMVYQAYRDLARVWDPQRFAHSPRLELMAEEKLKELIQAYHALQPDGYQGSMPPPDPPVSSAPRKETPAPAPDSFAAPPPPGPFAPQAPPDAFGAPPHAPTAGQPAPAATNRFSSAAVQTPLVPAAPYTLPRGFEPPQAPQAPRPAVTPEGMSPYSPEYQTIGAVPQAGTAAPAALSLQVRRQTLLVAGIAVLLVLGVAAFLYTLLSRPEQSTEIAPAAAVLDPAVPSASAPPAMEPGAEDAAGRPIPAVQRGALNAARRPAKAQEARVIETGTELMVPQGRGGAGKFRIANQSGHDAIARVSAQTAPESPLRLVYVKADTEIPIGNIGPGVYFVSFSLNPAAGKPVNGFGARFGPFQFVQVESVGGYQGDDYQIVLKPRP